VKRPVRAKVPTSLHHQRRRGTRWKTTFSAFQEVKLQAGSPGIRE
jgi:hypothetical protein